MRVSLRRVLGALRVLSSAKLTVTACAAAAAAAAAGHLQGGRGGHVAQPRGRGARAVCQRAGGCAHAGGGGMEPPLEGPRSPRPRRRLSQQPFLESSRQVIAALCARARPQPRGAQSSQRVLCRRLGRPQLSAQGRLSPGRRRRALRRVRVRRRRSAAAAVLRRGHALRRRQATAERRRGGRRRMRRTRGWAPALSSLARPRGRKQQLRLLRFRLDSQRGLRGERIQS